MLKFDKILKIIAWKLRHNSCNFDLYLMNASRSHLILLWSVLILNYLTNISRLNENNTESKYKSQFLKIQNKIIIKVYLSLIKLRWDLSIF